MLTNYFVIVLLAIILFPVVGWITGRDEYAGSSKDDERSRFIKQKAIVSSWIVVFGFLFINFIFDFFNLHKLQSQLEYPDLVYLLILVASYFIYYLIYNRQFSSNEK